MTAVRGSRRVTLAALTVISVCFLVALGAAQAQAVVTYDFSIGTGQLFEPSAVAVNETTGDVYVADGGGNQRVVRFDEDGDFISMWGWKVNKSTEANLCTAVSGDTCGPGLNGEEAGAFNFPLGIAVDNSGGPAAGSVYVQDGGNNRIQRFTADGQFVLTWGETVNQQTGGDLCTALSKQICQKGQISGSPGNPTGVPPIPPTPSDNGVFAGWGINSFDRAPNIAVDPQGFVYVGDPKAVLLPRIQKFTADGGFVGKVAPEQLQPSFGDLHRVRSITANAAGEVFAVTDRFASNQIYQFDPVDFTLAEGGEVRRTFAKDYEVQGAAVDPSNQYLFAFAEECHGKPGTNGLHIVEFHPSTQEVDCTVEPSADLSSIGGVVITQSHRMYIADEAANQIRVYETPVASPPQIHTQHASEITTRGVNIGTEISANLDDTTFHIEYGSAPCSANPCASTPESASIGAAFAPEPGVLRLEGLSPDTTYFYRVVASNGVGSDTGGDRSFTTFPNPQFDPSCSNNLARQQTGAAFLFDCRAYELVSAEDQGGYDVESDLVSGQTPFAGYPLATGKALYAVHNGGIPGMGQPTNRGPDPYIATRDSQSGRWVTSYVGIPANAPSLEPFSSTVSGADSSLATFAFGGPEICNPCFGDATSGVPLRRPDGTLVQGMKGPISVTDPQPAGEIRKPLSADGSHLVFGSMQKFTADGNETGTDLTIYDRNLNTGITQVVSKTPGAETFAVDDEIAELDISSDGKRILLGERVGADAGGNPLWHLYMHIGGAINSIDLTPGTTSGVHYAGMTSTGTKVYFTTDDPLATPSVQDTDESADLYRADVSSETAILTRVSTGSGAGDTDSCDPAANSAREHWNTLETEANCDAVAIGGGGGVALGGGVVYFLSPEQLDGSQGVQDAPNLYAAEPGSPPEFVATLESSLHTPLEPKRHLFERSFGSFSYPEGIAIDHQSGSTYVLDTIATSGAPGQNGEPEYTPGAFVQKFDSSGQPDLTFAVNSKLGKSPLDGPFLEAGEGLVGSPVGIATQIAVDNSGGPSNRALYVPDVGNAKIYKFGPSGNFLSSIKLGFGFPPSGVGVNQSNGNVYATTNYLSNEVYTFNSNGSSIGPKNFTVDGPALGVAVDSAGNAYVVNGKDTRVYSAAGNFVKVFDPNPSFGVAIDPSDGHVYVDEGDHVVEFDAAGTPIDETLGAGILDDSVSLAADSGRLAVSNPGRGRAISYTTPRVPPNSGYDNPLVIHSVGSPEVRRTADFQLTTSGAHGVFPSSMSLTGVDSLGTYQLFRYARSPGALDCVSCNPTEADPSGDASLAGIGSSITDDGRVFFTTGEPLVLRDTNSKLDAYEWREGEVELISSGQSNFDSGLFSVSADGTDAFFYTREVLTSRDGNGNLVKLYDARSDGGFFTIPPAPPCAAPDECRGAGTEPPPPVPIGTATGSGGNEEAGAKKQPKRCKKGLLKRRGRCVRSGKSRTRSNGGRHR